MPKTCEVDSFEFGCEFNTKQLSELFAILASEWYLWCKFLQIVCKIYF